MKIENHPYIQWASSQESSPFISYKWSSSQHLFQAFLVRFIILCEPSRVSVMAKSCRDNLSSKISIVVCVCVCGKNIRRFLTRHATFLCTSNNLKSFMKWCGAVRRCVCVEAKFASAFTLLQFVCPLVIAHQTAAKIPLTSYCFLLRFLQFCTRTRDLKKHPQ